MKAKRTLPIHKLFSSAGSYNYIGKNYDQDISLNLVQYNATEFIENLDISLNTCNEKITKNLVNWLEVSGIHQPEIIGDIGQNFAIHPLMIEDILNTTQKPKFEYFETEEQIFTILKIPKIDEETHEIEYEHISVVLSPEMVISFQEMDSQDIFEPIFLRLQKMPSKTRSRSADYLFYSMLDVVSDNYYLISNKIEELIGKLETEILNDPKPTHQVKLFFLKKEISEVKKNLRPIKEIITNLLIEPNIFISKEVKIYLKDVQDHVIENIDAMDSFREEIESLVSNYHSQISDKMNSVMKTLTVLTSIFMPLTFIAGIYGMNFVNIPELRCESGYFITLFAMLIIAACLWAYFKWKKYI